MANELNILFLFLFVCQVCLSARIIRQSDDSSVTTPATKAETPNGLPLLGSSLNFDQLQAEIGKTFNDNEKIEFNKIITNLKSANTLEGGLDGAFKLIEFGMKATLNHTNQYFASTEASVNKSDVRDN